MRHADHIARAVAALLKVRSRESDPSGLFPEISSFAFFCFSFLCSSPPMLIRTHNDDDGGDDGFIRQLYRD